MRFADAEDDDPGPPFETTGDSWRARILISSLEGLLRGLGHIPNGDASWQTQGLAVQLWSDPEYVYAEADLTGEFAPRSELDIFIGGGKAFLRLER